MTYSRLPVLGSLRLLTLAAALAVGLAHADDYADVSQLVRTGKLADALTKADLYLAGKPRDPQMRFLKGSFSVTPARRTMRSPPLPI